MLYQLSYYRVAKPINAASFAMAKLIHFFEIDQICRKKDFRVFTQLAKYVAKKDFRAPPEEGCAEILYRRGMDYLTAILQVRV